MRLWRNVAAGTVNSVWTALVNVAVLPFLIKLVGIEAYGLVGFYVAGFALLQLLDLGLAATINREVARLNAHGEDPQARQLLHSVAVVYWGIAVAVGLLLAVLAPFIVQHWLRLERLPAQEVTNAVRWMGLAVACRWPIALYFNAIVGMHRLSVSSTINSVMTTIANAGVLLVLKFVAPTIVVYFAWQAGVAFAQALVMRYAAWKILGRPAELRFDVTPLRSIARFSIGMTGIAITTILLMQLDKLILSRVISLRELGFYTLAWTVAGGLYLLITPVFNVLYPRFTVLLAREALPELASLYRLATKAFATVLFPCACFVAMFAQPLLAAWTHDPRVAEQAAPLLSLLIIGTALNGIMNLPYALQLASGRVRLAFLIALSLCCILVPLLIIFALRWHALGGAIAWCTLNVLYLFYGSWLTHRRLLPGMLFKWLFIDVGVPAGLSLGIVVGGAMVLRRFDIAWGPVVTLAVASLLPLLAIAATLAVSPRLRVAVGDRVRATLSSPELQKA